MSEYSTLQCDGCGAVIDEKGWARVDLPEDWTRNPYEPEDYCPECSTEMAADAAVLTPGERG